MAQKWYLTKSQANILEKLSTDEKAETTLSTLGLEIEILPDFAYDKLPDRKLVQLPMNRSERRLQSRKKQR